MCERPSQSRPPQSEQPFGRLKRQKKQEQRRQIPQIQRLPLHNTCFGVLQGVRNVVELVESPITSACGVCNPLQERAVLLCAEVLDHTVVAPEMSLQGANLDRAALCLHGEAI